MAGQKHHFEIFADYFQFYLRDEAAEYEIGDSWTKEAMGRMLIVTPGNIFVGTVRNMTVSVDIEIHEAEPVDNLDSWDHVNECSIEIKSGRIAIAGCTDYYPDTPRITISPGIYRARIYYGDLEALSDDGLEGDDHYRVFLWPSVFKPPIVLKQWIFAESRGG